jgi:hypothetical protein
MTIAQRRPFGQSYAWVVAGVLRDLQGRYLESFVIAGILGLVAAFATLAIRRDNDDGFPVPASAG